MTAQTPPRPAPRTPIWLRVLLFASLALNLLIVGAIVGHMLNDGPKGRVPRMDRVQGPMTFALSDEDRRAIGRALREEYRENRPSREQFVAEYQGVIAALRAEPFQPDLVEEALRRQRQAASDRIAVGHRLLVDRLTAMTTEERQAFADRLEEGLRRGPPFKRKPGDDDRPKD